jgi:hypothetical protein
MYNNSFCVLNYIKDKEKEWTFKKRVVYKERTGRCKICQVCTHNEPFKPVERFKTTKEYLSYVNSINTMGICSKCCRLEDTKYKSHNLVKQDEYLVKLHNFEYYE